MLVAVVLVGWVLVGLWLLVTGLRSRAVDDHPVCAACGYDLVGMRHAMPGNCPECGVVLRSEAGEAQGVRVGNRSRRNKRAWWGALALTMWLMVAVPLGLSILGSSKLTKYQPTWVLILQAEHVSGRAANAAVDELMSRAKVKGTVPVGVQTRLVKRALAVQRLTSPTGRASAVWSSRWQGVLEDPAMFGLLSQSEQDEALVAGAHGWMRARQVVVEGRGLPLSVRVNFDPRFLSTTGRAASVKVVRVRVLDTSGKEVATRTLRMGFQGTAFASEGEGSWTGSEQTVPLDVTPGTYTLEAYCEVLLVDVSIAAVSGTVPIHHTQRVEVQAAGSAPAGVVDVPELIEQLRDKLRVSLRRSPYSQTKTWVSMGWGDPGPAMKGLGDDLERRGVACVYKVTMRPQEWDGPEVDIGKFVLWHRDGRWGVMPGGKELENPVPGGKYRLRLTPDWDYAEGTVEHEKILGGEIELQDVTLSDK